MAPRTRPWVRVPVVGVVEHPSPSLGEVVICVLLEIVRRNSSSRAQTRGDEGDKFRVCVEACRDGEGCSREVHLLSSSSSASNDAGGESSVGQLVFQLVSRHFSELTDVGVVSALVSGRFLLERPEVRDDSGQTHSAIEAGGKVGITRDSASLCTTPISCQFVYPDTSRRPSTDSARSF